MGEGGLTGEQRERQNVRQSDERLLGNFILAGLVPPEGLEGVLQANHPLVPSSLCRKLYVATISQLIRQKAPNFETLLTQTAWKSRCSSATYWLSPPAAEVGGLEGLDLHALLAGRPQPGVVVARAAAVLLPAAPERRDNS